MWRLGALGDKAGIWEDLLDGHKFTSSGSLDRELMWQEIFLWESEVDPFCHGIVDPNLSEKTSSSGSGGC